MAFTQLGEKFGFNLPSNTGLLGRVKKQNGNFLVYRNAYCAVSIYTETYLKHNMIFKMLVEEKMTSEIQRKFQKIEIKRTIFNFLDSRY